MHNDAFPGVLRNPGGRLKPAPERPGDRVELSAHARLLGRLRQLPEARYDRIERIRDAIADGTYQTGDKLDAALDRLLEDIS